MTARAIVSGAVFGPIEKKTSKNGKEYVLVTIREGDGDAVRWWAAFGFAETVIEELMRLTHGDPIAIAGEIDAKIWEPEGRGARLSLRITADAVLSLSKDAARKPPPARGRDRDDAA